MRHQNTNGWWWFLIVIALSLFSFLSVSRFSFCCSSLQVLDIHHLSLIIRRIHTYIITSTSPRPPPCISTIQRIVFSFLIFIFFFFVSCSFGLLRYPVQVVVYVLWLEYLFFFPVVFTCSVSCIHFLVVVFSFFVSIFFSYTR